jgi:hypothetical protein
MMRGAIGYFALVRHSCLTPMPSVVSQEWLTY